MSILDDEDLLIGEVQKSEELYDLVKHFQNKLIEKNKLRKKGENLYIL